MSTISSGGVAVKSFKECFTVQNRIDSEFYQPKYDKIISAIKNYDPDSNPIDKVATYVFTGECAGEYYNYEDGLLHYVRGTDIHDGKVDIDLEHAVESIKHKNLFQQEIL